MLSYAQYGDATVPGAGSMVRLVPGEKPEEVAYGFRNPLGWCAGPEGVVFFTDNQGEWVATNKLHHLKPGKFYGHQAGLRWVKDSPFAGKVSDKVASGMRYDGVDASGKFTGVYPDRMGRARKSTFERSPSSASKTTKPTRSVATPSISWEWIAP